MVVVGRFLLSSKISNRVKTKEEASNHGAQLSRASHEHLLLPAPPHYLSTIPPILFFLFFLPFTPLFVLLFRGTIHDFSFCPKPFLNVHHLPSRRGILYAGKVISTRSIQWNSMSRAPPPSFLLLFFDSSRVTFVYRVLIIYSMYS